MDDEALQKSELHKEKNLSISNINGRTQIVFRKALLKGKVSSHDVLNTILIAARMQAEKFIEKLSRGAPLDASEVKSLRDLAEITKLEAPAPAKLENIIDSQQFGQLKSTSYIALLEKVSSQKVS